MKPKDEGVAEVKVTLQSQDKPTKSPTSSIWFSKRLVIVIMLFFGYMLYGLGNNVMSIAIVEMTSPKSSTSGNLTTITDPEFRWNSIEVSVILNMYHCGYFFSPVGGYLAHRFGGTGISGVAMILAGVLKLLTPFSIRCNFHLFLVLRGLIGVLQGFCNACDANIFSRWIPEHERAILMAHIVNGLYLSVVVAYSLGGFIIYYCGWQMIFYAAGIVFITWSVLWLILVHDDPTKDKCVSDKELIYITHRTSNITKKNGSHPYKDILKMSSFWALSLGKLMFSWGITFLVGCFPLYIKDVTRKNIKDVGNLSLIPSAVNSCIIPFAGMLINYWQNYYHSEANMLYKTLLSGGYILVAILFGITSILSDFLISTTLLTIIRIILSLNKILLELITVNMAPNHSSLLSGLTLFWQTAGFISGQMLIGFFVRNHKIEEWNTCFHWTACFSVVIAITFAFFGSSEPQSWSLAGSQDKSEDLQTQNKKLLK